jgi:hypothetical protein
LSKIKLALLTSLAVIGVVGGSAASAQAATTAACQFSGQTTSLSPAVQFVGGGGNFTFSGPATCSVNGGAPQSGSITASGSYANTVCGTGSATGSATITAGSATVTIGFTINFAAGQGVARGTGATTGAGYVGIRPALDNQAAPPGDCVTKFDVVGAFGGQTA